MTLHLSQIFFTEALTFINRSLVFRRWSLAFRKPRSLALLGMTKLGKYHLYRYTRRPRFTSWGESSTATLSPGRMRIKFLRILPETCASTWCLFSSSTLNIALGRGSITTAITSIASSLLMHSLFQFSVKALHLLRADS